jgi:hypothetical protein
VSSIKQQLGDIHFAHPKGLGPGRTGQVAQAVHLTAGPMWASVKSTAY